MANNMDDIELNDADEVNTVDTNDAVEEIAVSETETTVEVETTAIDETEVSTDAQKEQTEDAEPVPASTEEVSGENGEGEPKPKQKRNRSSRNTPKPILDENGNVIERLSTEKAMRVLEAILFANGDEVYYDQFARIIGYTTKEAKSIVDTYAKLYDNGAFPRGIRLVCYEKCCQLSTHPDMSEYVKKMIGVRGEPQLSNAALETLAIIAYHQPITRAYVEQVRGVDSTRPITVLLDRELIEEVGRLEALGRPRLFGVTQNFFKTFGITSIEDLPSLDLFGTD